MDRTTRRRFLEMAAAGGASALWGCGSGGGGGAAAPALGGSALAQGRAALDQVASGGKTADPDTLDGVRRLFEEALRLAPGSAEAAFGAAVCLAGVAGQDADGAAIAAGSANGGGGRPLLPGAGGASGGFGGGTAPGSPVWEMPPAPPGQPVEILPVPPRYARGLFWHLEFGLQNPFTLLDVLSPVADLRYGLAPFLGYAGDDAPRRIALLEKLGRISELLTQVEASPDFSLTLLVRRSYSGGAQGGSGGSGGASAPESLSLAPSPEPERVIVGLPEVYLFHALVESLRAETALSLAYVRDTGAPPPPPFANGGGSGTAGSGASGSPASFPPPADLNGDGLLNPNEYLPPAPFLTLRGAQYLRTAQSALRALADRAGRGASGVLARPKNDFTFLVSNAYPFRESLTRLRDEALPLLAQAADGPVTLEFPASVPVPLVAYRNAGGATEPHSAHTPALFPPEDSVPPMLERRAVRVNLAAWFAAPPPDLRALAPAYPLHPDGWPRTDAARYPDPTFAGLFPDGLPASLRF